MKDFYFKLNGTVITDAIDYPYEGYTKVTLAENQLPAGINGGWWKLENGVAVEYPELKPIDETELLKQRVADLELQVTILTGGVV